LNWRLYAGFAVTLICILPIVYWNIQNDFITYRFHAERVTNTSVQWDMLGREIGGEIAYQNPVIFLLILAALAALFRRRIRFNRKKASTWLLCMSLPMIFIFWGISLTNPTLPHWSGPGYIPLFLVAGLYLEHRSLRVVPIVTKIAASLLIIVLITGIALIRFSPVNFGSHDRANYGEYCPTLDLSGWRAFSDDFTAIAKDDIAHQRMQSNSPILIDKWFPAGHLEFYTSRASGLPILAVGQLEDIHKFAWLNKERRPLYLGEDAYAIVPSNVPDDVKQAYGKYFTSIDAPVIVEQKRSGKTVRYFYVYRLKQCKLVPKPVL
jgi:hypothetical protein